MVARISTILCNNYYYQTEWLQAEDLLSRKEALEDPVEFRDCPSLIIEQSTTIGCQLVQ